MSTDSIENFITSYGLLNITIIGDFLNGIGIELWIPLGSSPYTWYGVEVLGLAKLIFEVGDSSSTS